MQDGIRKGQEGGKGEQGGPREIGKGAGWGLLPHLAVVPAAQWLSTVLQTLFRLVSGCHRSMAPRREGKGEGNAAVLPFHWSQQKLGPLFQWPVKCVAPVTLKTLPNSWLYWCFPDIFKAKSSPSSKQNSIITGLRRKKNVMIVSYGLWLRFIILTKRLRVFDISEYMIHLKTIYWPCAMCWALGIQKGMTLRILQHRGFSPSPCTQKMSKAKSE